MKTPGPIKTGFFASIIATTAGRFGVFSATTVTSPSGTDAPRSSCSPLPPTYEITRDSVEAVVDGGVEDVFDIEVEHTENFIANGLVSHNTRWHEDDLIGRLLASDEGWEHVYLPALDESGAALWPERFDVEALERTRREIGSRSFSAQYQGQPTPVAGGILKARWFGVYTVPEPRYLAIIQAWDTAFKAGVENDYSVCLTLGVTLSSYDVLDVWRDRVEFPELERAAVDQATLWRARYPETPYTLLIEDKASGQSLIQSLQRRTRLGPIAVPATRPNEKQQRVEEIAPTVEGGLVRLPAVAAWRDAFLHEVTRFPFAAHDDQADALAIAVRRAAGIDRGGERATSESYWKTSSAPNRRRRRLHAAA